MGNHSIQALQRLQQFTGRIESFSGENLEAEILDMMQRVHPEKFEFVGGRILRVLIGQAQGDAARFQITTPAGVGLLGALMFALGHGIARDPLYPWVHNTLTSPPDQDQERIARLRLLARTHNFAYNPCPAVGQGEVQERASGA